MMAETKKAAKAAPKAPAAKKAAKASAPKKGATVSNKKFEDLRVKTDDQLVDQLTELKREQFNLRFQSATNQLERPARIREVRRTIAQIRTLQTERTRSAKA
jgi:large subunit ribosomal protein L29